MRTLAASRTQAGLRPPVARLVERLLLAAKAHGLGGNIATLKGPGPNAIKEALGIPAEKRVWSVVTVGQVDVEARDARPPKAAARSQAECGLRPLGPLLAVDASEGANQSEVSDKDGQAEGSLDTRNVRPEPGVVLKQFTTVDVVSRWSVPTIASNATALLASRALDDVVARMPFAVKAIQVRRGSHHLRTASRRSSSTNTSKVWKASTAAQRATT